MKKVQTTTITVSGPAGCGKSTVAQHFAAYLAHEHGFNVTLVDDGQRQGLPESRIEFPENFNTDVVIIVEQK